MRITISRVVYLPNKFLTLQIILSCDNWKNLCMAKKGWLVAVAAAGLIGTRDWYFSQWPCNNRDLSHAPIITLRAPDYF